MITQKKQICNTCNKWRGNRINLTFTDTSWIAGTLPQGTTLCSLIGNSKSGTGRDIGYQRSLWYIVWMIYFGAEIFHVWTKLGRVGTWNWQRAKSKGEVDRPWERKKSWHNLFDYLSAVIFVRKKSLKFVKIWTPPRLRQAGITFRQVRLIMHPPSHEATLLPFSEPTF